jgi:hypothetical protein
VRVHRERAHVGEHDGVAVGRGLGDMVDGDIAAGAGAVLDHDLLPELLAENRLQDAGGRVGPSAGLETDHDGDRLVGVLRQANSPGNQKYAEQTYSRVHTTPPCLSFAISAAL